MDNKELKAGYVDVLRNIDPGYLQRPELRRGGSKGLSGLFLPTVDETYRLAKNKVMIIGSETAGWEPLKMTGEKGKYFDYESVEQYVETGMRKHQSFFAKELAKKKADRGHTFHNFVRDVARVADKNGLIYSNLFCFDWRKSSPMKCPEFKFVKRLSQLLLETQIRLLKPDYIIFANGITSAKHRREFFPVGEGARCTNTRSYPEIAPAHYLWEFTLDEAIRCYRVHHPSARHKMAAIGRAGAIELLTLSIERPAYSPTLETIE